ncbi:MAG: aminotransferase class V-fold PLP-dependent enzyme, partial [Gemmatimonadaceae bacterium]
MIYRRDFLLRAAGTLGALAISPSALQAAHEESRALAARLGTALARRGTGAAPDRLAIDESFWAEVRRAFELEPEVINLDHGWTNPAPRAAMDDLVRGARLLGALPAERLAKLWPEVTNTTVRAAVAEAMLVPGDSIAFVRNATEALDTVLLGVPLERGDEVVCSTHDYYATLDALEQRQARDGIVLKMLRPAVPARSLDAIARMYEEAITARTRLVLLTHPSNVSGQLLPVRRIAEAAHRAGAEVVVDGAQSFGLLEGSVADLGADYYGASLHKWFGAPIGMGVLWMRREHIAKVWPLVPSPQTEKGMGRFEWIGTAPDYVGPAILPAVALHNSLGPARKAARLRYLGNYWRERVASALPQARFYTLPSAEMSSWLCLVEVP